MKEYKLAGRFTNGNIQKALRNANQATLVEAGVSCVVIFGIEYLADAAWDGTKWIFEKITGSPKKKEGGKKK